jgi:hypothetical protein
MPSSTSRTQPSLPSGWVVWGSGDNGVSIFAYDVPVSSAREAAELAATVARLMDDSAAPNPVYYNVISIRSWQLEIRVSVEGEPDSSQREFMTAVSELFTAR